MIKALHCPTFLIYGQHWGVHAGVNYVFGESAKLLEVLGIFFKEGDTAKDAGAQCLFVLIV